MSGQSGFGSSDIWGPRYADLARFLLSTRGVFLARFVHPRVGTLRAVSASAMPARLARSLHMHAPCQVSCALRRVYHSCAIPRGYRLC